MKEYVYTDLECLIDINTELPIRIYIPKDEIEKYNEIAKAGYESGYRLKMALQEMGLI
jgi:hypothetical protein